VVVAHPEVSISTARQPPPRPEPSGKRRSAGGGSRSAVVLQKSPNPTQARWPLLGTQTSRRAPVPSSVTAPPRRSPPPFRFAFHPPILSLPLPIALFPFLSAGPATSRTNPPPVFASLIRGRTHGLVAGEQLRLLLQGPAHRGLGRRQEQPPRQLRLRLPCRRRHRAHHRYAPRLHEQIASLSYIYHNYLIESSFEKTQAAKCTGQTGLLTRTYIYPHVGVSAQRLTGPFSLS
jgi:hypothetical protein